MRDILIFILIISCIPFCLTRPFFGILAWSWIGFMNPHKLTWGFSYDFPFAQLIGVATIAGFVFAGLKAKKFPPLPMERETILMLLLWLMFLFTSIFAIRQDLAWPEFSKLSKILFMTVLAIILIDNEKKLRLLLLVISLSIGFYGLKGGVFSIISGGQSMVLGPPNSSIADNTALGLALNMCLPLLYFLALTEKNRWLKWLLYLTLSMSILSVLFTYSRGAFIGLAAVGLLIILHSSFKLKIYVVLFMLVAAPITINMIPDKWFDRIDTIQNYEDDGSANSRFEAWKTAWRLAVDRPLVGGGFQVIDDHSIYEKYNPEAFSLISDISGVHSVYLEVLGENGFITFFIFILLMLFSYFSCRSIASAEKKSPDRKMYAYSTMLGISILAYAISGAFLEFASFDLYYNVIALSIITKVVYKKELAARDLGETITNNTSVDRST